MRRVGGDDEQPIGEIVQLDGQAAKAGSTISIGREHSVPIADMATSRINSTMT